MTRPLLPARHFGDQHDTSTPWRRKSAHATHAGVAGLLLLLVAGCGGHVEPTEAPQSAQQPGPVSQPPPQPVQQPGPASQPPRTSVLLFGGLGVTSDGGSTTFGDTWSWTEAAGWTEMHPTVSPPARFGAMAAVSGTDVVLFGGVTEGPSAGESAETWAWDGASWTQRRPSFSPPPLTSSLLAPLGDSLFLFGGYDEGVLYEDVWRWDSATWSHLTPSATPSAREAPAGAVVNGSLVVFGGEDVNFLPLGDTWVFDGTSWTQMHSAHSPSPRRGASAAAFRGKLVLFGGDTIPQPYGDWYSVNETWVWDGMDWTEMHPSSSPDSRSFAGMASTGDQVVLFGGSNFGGDFGQPAGTWTWDGTSWTKRPGPDPEPRNYPTLASR